MQRPMLAVATTLLCLAADARQASALQFDRGTPDGDGLFSPDDHYRHGIFNPQRRIGHRDWFRVRAEQNSEVSAKLPALSRR